MRNKKSAKLTFVGVVITLALGYFVAQQQPGSSAEDGQSSATLSKGKGAFREAKVTDSTFTVLRDCKLDHSHYGNDGDSFKVQHQGQKTEFRLYYVDAPESKFKTYRNGEDNGDRLDDQAAYFGGLSRTKTTQVGTAAKTFTKKILSERPFTVVTKWENVYDPSRKYAFVLVEFEGGTRYLHEILIAKGLARLKTRGRQLPDGTSVKIQLDHLKSLEKIAKKEQLGAWSTSK